MRGDDACSSSRIAQICLRHVNDTCTRSVLQTLPAPIFSPHGTANEGGAIPRALGLHSRSRHLPKDHDEQGQPAVAWWWAECTSGIEIEICRDTRATMTIIIIVRILIVNACSWKLPICSMLSPCHLMGSTLSSVWYLFHHPFRRPSHLLHRNVLTCQASPKPCLPQSKDRHPSDHAAHPYRSVNLYRAQKQDHVTQTSRPITITSSEVQSAENGCHVSSPQPKPESSSMPSSLICSSHRYSSKSFQ